MAGIKTYRLIPRDPSFDPFEQGVNQDLRDSLFPVDPEDERGVAEI